MAQGRFDEAIAEGKRAGELDPLSLIISENLAETYFYSGDYDKSLEQERGTIALDPNFFLGHFGMGLAYEYKGMYGEAVAGCKQDIELNAGPNYRANLVQLYALTRNSDCAQKTPD